LTCFFHDKIKKSYKLYYKAHVKNTGRCKELLISGAKVVLEDCSDNLNRKTRYSIIAIWKGDILVNMDSQVPNAVVFEALKENKIEGFEDLTHLKREVTFGKSRYDIYFESIEQKGFIEVKGVTLENHGVSMFPDAPTERGAKHVLEMIEAVKLANKKGVEILAYDSVVTGNGIHIDEPVEIDLHELYT